MKQKPPGNGVKAKQPTEGNNSREAASGIHERKRGRLLKVPKLPNTQVWRFQGGMGGLWHGAEWVNNTRKTQLCTTCQRTWLDSSDTQVTCTMCHAEMGTPTTLFGPTQTTKHTNKTPPKHNRHHQTPLKPSSCGAWAQWKDQGSPSTVGQLQHQTSALEPGLHPLLITRFTSQKIWFWTIGTYVE